MPAKDEFDKRSFLRKNRIDPVLPATSPTTYSLRSAGLRLLNQGYHSEAELLFRSAIGTGDNPEFVARTTEDIARAILPRLPVQSLALVEELERKCAPGCDSTSMTNLRGRIFYELYRLDDAEREYREAKQKAKETKDIKYLGYTLANLGSILFERGNIEKSTDYCRRAVETLTGSGNSNDAMVVLCNMLSHSIVLGNIDKALTILEDLRIGTKIINSAWFMGWYEFVRGELELMTGDDGRAMEHFDRAIDHATIAANSAIQARALTWKTVLEESHDTMSLLRDLENAAQDLYMRGLCSDSASVLLIAAKFAESRGLGGEARQAVAHEILGNYGRMLDSHYDRLFRTVTTRRPPVESQPLPTFLTQSSRLIQAKEKVAKLAATDVRLMIEGESGTGKSFLAGLIHEKSRGNRGAFIVVDCTNLEKNLFESKLFGHMRGSFTGAVSNSVGLVEQADGGTLFLDEIGELPLEIQAKLLYTIEEQRFRPVGAKMEKTADFRVIAATNRDIDAMLDNGTLRRDLYFRIAGYRVELPPLRERREDIVPLAELQLERLNERYGRKKVLRPGVWELLARYDWPGNVRELNAVLERGFHLCQGRRISQEDLGLGLSPTDGSIEDLSWDAVRRDHLLRVLRLCRANVTRAAKILKMNRTTLIYKLKQLGIDRSDFDPSCEPISEDEESISKDEEAAEAPSLRLVADRESETAPDEGMDGAE